MRFHKNELPNDEDTTMVSIISVDRSMTIIRVALLEYDDIEGNIFFSNISKKLKAINKFIKKKGSDPFPCSVYNVDKGIPNLSPVKGDAEWDLTVNRYGCLVKLERLADDFIFENKDIDSVEIYDKFLWAVSTKLCEMPSVNKDLFTHYLEHLSEMFSLSVLDESNILTFTESINPRITCSDLVMTSAITIMVISSHGLDTLNALLSKLNENVEAVYYQDAPSYKLTVKGSSEKECRDGLIALSEVLKTHAKDNDVKVIIEYNAKDENIKSKIIRLSTLNKTDQLKV